MVFGLPRSSGFAQSLTLPANLDLALGQFREEGTSGAFADESVDVGAPPQQEGLRAPSGSSS